MTRGGWIGSDPDSDGSGQFDHLKKIKLDHIEIIHMLCFSYF
jgi:hypothetical protein